MFGAYYHFIDRYEYAWTSNNMNVILLVSAETKDNVRPQLKP